MNETEQNIWPKKITVDKRIVKILSEATYEDFPNALKELIVNSYDADATKVEIDINLERETISLVDDGWGMTESDFHHYIRIAAEPVKSKYTSSKRLKIGKFGVGFLSAFPFFKSYSIEATRKGNSEILYATIPCSQYFSSDKSIQLDNIEILGGIKINQKQVNISYTKITLKGFTDLCKSFFQSTYNYKPRKYSVLNFSGIERLKWKLQEDLPIKYSSGIFPEVFKQLSPNLAFEVIFNESPLYRPIYGTQILESNIGNPKQIGNIKFQYFIATNKKSVTPSEAKFFKIRNLNVGVGSRTNFGLGTEVGGARSRLHWLTGEIHILEGLNDLITVARDNFNFSHDYEELKEFFLKKLTYYSNLLENEADIIRFVNEKEESRITDLKLLKPEVISGKLESLKKSEIIEADEVRSLIKTSNLRSYKILNKNYSLKSTGWDYKTDFYPACRIEEDTILINNRYPLFKKKRYTDLFIKIHVLLINKFNNKKISKDSYKEITTDLLKMFKDY